MGEGPKINVFECANFLATPAQEKAARDSLFGAKTSLSLGGWSFYDNDLILNALISPPRITGLETARDTGLKFMRDANVRFKKNDGTGILFPLDKGIFRLRVVELFLYKISDEQPLAWKVTWHVDANPGSVADLPKTEDAWVPVAGAHISLVIELSGRVIGGDACWRPVIRTLPAPQLLSPEEMMTDIKQSRTKHAAQAALEHASVSGNVDHGAHHGQDSPSANADPSAETASEMRIVAVYATSSPSQFRQFIEPRLILVDEDAGGHGHGPRLEVPVTDYGICVSLLTSSVSTREGGKVLVEPWVVNAKGQVDVSVDSERVKSYWTVRPHGSFDENEISRYSTGAPLTLSGMFEVTYTVQTAAGAIAHAHAMVSSAQEAGTPALVS